MRSGTVAVALVFSGFGLVRALLYRGVRDTWVQWLVDAMHADELMSADDVAFLMPDLSKATHGVVNVLTQKTVVRCSRHS